MLIEEVEKEIKTGRKKGEFLYPFYDKYCLSNVPGLILNLFGIKSNRSLPDEGVKASLEVENVNKIILIMLDGVGYGRWPRRGIPLFDLLVEEGVVFPITSVFPSTTTAALTTVNTGLTPQEHALLEWYMYFEELDEVVATILFSPLGEKYPDKLADAGVNPNVLFGGRTIHQKLRKEGVLSFSFLSALYASGVYSRRLHRGSELIPFVNFSDLVVALRKMLEKAPAPAFFYVYWDAIDAMEHRYGPGGEEQNLELSALSFLLRAELLPKVKRKAAKETLLLVTSDHGQVKVNPRGTVYLNRYRRLLRNLRRGRRGKPIPPTGSSRDVYLHVEPGKLEETLELLSEKLRGKAKVVKTLEALRSGLFGAGKVNKKFYSRAGDLLILPLNGRTVWYKYPKQRRAEFKGHHGGLSEEEMLIPFGAVTLSSLQGRSKKATGV